jgi:RNA recognition motif-containing protein
MGTRLYVGNLPYKATEEDLTALFSRAGAVDNVRVMRDMATGRARGFAFVEMASEADAQKAISEFHQFQYEGRPLVVNEARPKEAGGGGGFRGRRGGMDDKDFAGGRRKEPRW